MLKKLITFLLAFSLVFVKAQYLIRDNFKNFNTAGATNGELNGQNGWNNQYQLGNGNYSGGTGDALTGGLNNGVRGKIISGNMSISGFITTDKVLSIRSNGDGIGKVFSTFPSSGAVYVAIPLTITAFTKASDNLPITSETQVLRLVRQSGPDLFPETVCRFTALPVAGGYNIGCYKGLNTSVYNSSPTLLTLNQANLIVLKYEFVQGDNNDIVSVYINPNLSLPEAANIPEVTAVGNTDFTNIQSVNLNYNNVNRAASLIGGLMVSTTWPLIQNALPTNCITNLQVVKTGSDKAKLIWDATSCKEIKDFTVQTGLQTNSLDNTKLVDSKEDGRYQSEFTLSQGTNFVRLVTTDFNGQKLYSQILSVKNGGIIKQLELYPNPTKNQLNITLKAEAQQIATLQIFNLQGKLVFQHQRNLLVGQNVMSLDVANLPKGLYTFKTVLTNDNSESKSFIKN